MADDDVILNVYELLPEQQQQQQGGAAGFFARMLPSMGLGAYHTSLEVKGYCYAFAAGSGIHKITSSQRDRLGVPPNAAYKESIYLGVCRLNRGQINEVVNKLGKLYFTPTAYHLVHRNCNHFTETFATALILADRLAEEDNPPSLLLLDKYPKWVNRLAKSGAALGIPENPSSTKSEMTEVTTCNVVEEARKAVGANEKVGWGLSSSKKKDNAKGASSKKKKELTEKQKAALAKLKRSSGKP